MDKAFRLYKRFIEGEGKYWLKELDYYGKKQFSLSVAEVPFTIGQLYAWLIETGLNQCLDASSKCLSGTSAQGKGKTFKGFLWFSLPLMRKYLNPLDQHILIPTQPESVQFTRDELYKFLKTLHKFAQSIDAADKAQSKVKIQHPKLGYLSAVEWYEFALDLYLYSRKFKLKLDEEVRSKYVVNSTEQDLIDADLES
jgi:hypothetical protein